MADMAKFMAALVGIGETLNRAANATQDDFQLGAAYRSDDMKASAAYHPYPPPTTFTVGPPPRSAQERKKFLRIEKDKDAFLLMVPTASPDNLMGRRAYRHWGEWHVKVVEDDRPLLLESFDEYDEAAAYVARVLATVGDESTEDEHEYASVGEVPC